MRTRIGTTETSSTSAARVVVEARRASEHRVRDRRRQLVRRARAHAARSRRTGCRRSRRTPRRRRRRRATATALSDSGVELEDDRVVGANRADGRAQRMARRRLAAAEGENEQRAERADPPPEHRDRVERRVVGPVHVLEHEHRRPRRELELRDQQALDLVRRRAGGERLLERRRDASDEVSERAERPRESRGRRRCRRAPAPPRRGPAGTGSRARSCRSPARR